MRRRLILVALVLLAVVPVGLPAAARAGSVAGLDVERLGARIEVAQERVERWYARVERWYGRIHRASMRVERLEAIVDRAADDQGLGLLRRSTPRLGEPSLRLALANEHLRDVLTDRRGRRAQAQLDTWNAYLAELTRALERALRPEPEPSANAPSSGASGGLSGLAGRPLTYETWATAFLRWLEAPACGQNLLVVVTWETSESTAAAFNPLATTRDMPGATDMNSVGVKDYVTLRQGLDASRDTLLLGADSYGYDAIVRSLRACAPAERTARAINASAWCRGCVGGAYITGLLPIVRASYAEHAARAISTGASSGPPRRTTPGARARSDGPASSASPRPTDLPE